ncbi:MAG: HAD family hydrolase [Bacteroidota bacterium]
MTESDNSQTIIKEIRKEKIGNIELAEDHRKAYYIEGSEIELVEKIDDDFTIEKVILDHDGTISTLREGWEVVMHQVMMEVICGSKLSELSKEKYNEISLKCERFIDDTTGIQTIVQMQGLRDMVIEENFIPQNEIKTAAEYKAFYLDRLMVSVNDRMRRFKSGERELCDFVIQGASNLLDSLRERELKLFLASGTDEDDVIIEAETLGYADYFNGGIRGSKGNEIGDAKKIVIERIIKEDNSAGKNLMVIGDGPVEIIEGRKAGALCIGVASDEVRRHGINFKKRTRLIKAGAHIIIPDFSQLPLILQTIFRK